MKKKSVITGITIIVSVAACIFLRTRHELLGNMGNNYTEQTTAASDISFPGEAGEKIKFSLRSDVIAGDLDIILYNSNGDEVYVLDDAEELETFFTLDCTDIYTLMARCTGFAGKYKISVYKAG